MACTNAIVSPCNDFLCRCQRLNEMRNGKLGTDSPNNVCGQSRMVTRTDKEMWLCNFLESVHVEDKIRDSRFLHLNE